MRREGRSRWVLPTIRYPLLTVLFLLGTCHLSLVTDLPAQEIASNSIITTVAGNGRVFHGDGGLATSAALGEVAAVAIDSAGNVYATDFSNNLVIKITPGGTIRVVAGNNIAGFSGDGGPATSASLNLGAFNGMSGVTVDTAGNLYIADSNNLRVRRVSPDGTISTIAGIGRCCFSGDGGLATSASLGRAAGLAMDGSGNLYVADFDANRVRRISPDGTIRTVAGNGVTSFSGDGGPATSASLRTPTGVAVDAAGNLYIADRDNRRVRKVSAAGIITTVAGNGVEGDSGDGGPAVSASLVGPTGVSVDESDNLYIATGGGRIRKVNTAGIITTVTGGGNSNPDQGGLAVNAALDQPWSVVPRAGQLYIAETRAGKIRAVDPSGVLRTIAGTGLVNFSGDGGFGNLASLNQPGGLAVDAAGNLYIADRLNNRVRKLTPAGIISTVAGNGNGGFSGDGGPATAASLYPSGVAVDASRNLFIADRVNSRIRKVDALGRITTVAGTGSRGYTGDGGPATAAALYLPEDVALDRFGNLYIADSNNYRVRKVDLSGVITTVAGNGVRAYSGDGGPAVNASIGGPTGVSIDESGNLYIATDVPGELSRVRKVSPDGIISTAAGGPGTGFASIHGVTVDRQGNLLIAEGSAAHAVLGINADGSRRFIAGTTTRGFSGDGGAATSALLNDPRGIAVDAAGNLFIADTGNDRVHKVSASPPTFTFAPASLSFRAQAGAGQVPSQSITITSSAIGLAWAVDVFTESGGNWLSVSPTSGTMPGLADVSVNAANLAPGTYRGTVTIVAALAAAPSQTVAVDLTVESAPPAKLTVEPTALSFETLTGSNPSARTLRIGNAGGGPLDWTILAETATGGSWLNVAPTSGSVSSSIFSQVRVAVNSAALATGFYSGTVVLLSAATGDALRVPVTLLVSPPRATILLSQSGLLFTGVEGGGVIPPQNFGVINTGEGVMNWTAEASTLSGSNWLTVSPREGSTDTASLNVPLVDVGVNIAGLAAGQYSGLVQVNATGATNSPQFVTVELNILPRGSNPGPLIRPTGLIFAAQAGTSSPSSQTVSLSNITSGTVDIVSGLFTADGGNWIEALPRNLTLTPSDATQSIVVQPSLGSFSPGVYRSFLTLAPGDGSPQVVSVLFLVVRQTGSVTPARGAQAGLIEPQSHSACVPTQLFASHRTLGTSFSSPIGWPNTIEAQVVDDCGHAVPDATVVARFSNGDPPVVLNSLRNGIYVGTWSPATAAMQVLVTLRAELPPLTVAEVTAQGSTGATSASPAVFAGGIVNTASYGKGEGLAPGSIISVFGRNLARARTLASQLPLETSLGGVRVSIGGVDLPLFYAGEGQINAQLPFDLTPNTRQVIVVRAARENGTQAYTVPETVAITSSRPAIFSLNQQGTGQGAILNQNYSANSATNPAARGSVIQIFATGLGTTNPVLASGQPAPSNPPALVTSAVEARIGGQPATVQFAGLAPGFVGLYQVNVVVPPGIQPGMEVELTLTQNGVPSNPVTLALQ